MKTILASAAFLLAATATQALAGIGPPLSGDAPGLLALGAAALVVGVQAARRGRK